MENRPILVIAGDSQSREFISGILTRSDFEVVSVPDGPLAIQFARKVRPAVILLEIVVPGMEGIGTCQDLKKDSVLRRIPIVGITTSAENKCTEQAFHAGAAFCLAKPFGEASLVQMVELASDMAQREVPMNHRRHPRYPAQIPVHCFIGDDETAKEVIGETGDVSLVGLRLWLPEQLTPGTAFRLRLGLSDGPVHVEGVVVWKNPQSKNDGGTDHGVWLMRFDKDSDFLRYKLCIDEIAKIPAQ